MGDNNVLTHDEIEMLVLLDRTDKSMLDQFTIRLEVLETDILVKVVDNKRLTPCCISSVDSNEICIMIPVDEISINTIVHETNHAVDAVIRNKGLNKEDGELKSYMLGYISDTIYQNVKDNLEDVL